MRETSKPSTAIPDDNPSRTLAIADVGDDASLPHIGLVGDTYTITVRGSDTAGRYTVIDMHVPPGGGPPPHRHDFEETFILLEGEMEATFRGEKKTVKQETQRRSRRTLRTSSRTFRTSRYGCFAFARLPVRMSSSCWWACR